jgi:hypothetical protein
VAGRLSDPKCDFSAAMIRRHDFATARHHRAIDSAICTERIDEANGRDRCTRAIIITRSDHHRFAQKFFARMMMCNAIA